MTLLHYFNVLCNLPARFAIWLREKLRNYAFSDYKQRLDRENHRQIEDRIALIEQHVEENADITALVRRKLHGFDPRYVAGPDVTSIFDWAGLDAESENSFLSDLHEVAKNDSFRTLLKYLTANQVMYSVRWAKDMKEVDFSRASINGLSLVEEEVDRLNAIYLARMEAEEPFDEHEVM